MWKKNASWGSSATEPRNAAISNAIEPFIPVGRFLNKHQLQCHFLVLSRHFDSGRDNAKLIKPVFFDLNLARIVLVVDIQYFLIPLDWESVKEQIYNFVRMVFL